jgi:hypothetical protein
MHNRF